MSDLILNGPTAHTRYPTCVWWRRLDDGRELVILHPDWRTRTLRVCIGPPIAGTWRDFWETDEPEMSLAQKLARWDLTGDPPTRWTHHSGSQRSRRYTDRELVDEWDGR